jgi:glycosyltransferase involved in cell wall biosynthesis
VPDSFSVVIPAKNEQHNITRCIESVIAATKGLACRKIILVDCASEDLTVECAKSYPVTILRLKPDWPHSASAARFIGSKEAGGSFIFFIDADMTLHPGFIEAGISLLQTDKTIAGVNGIGDEIYYEGKTVAGHNINLYKTGPAQQTVSFLGGAALYRSAIIQHEENFNPYLHAGEEWNLACRLQRAGYRVCSIPIPMITHHTARIDTWQEFKRKKDASLYFGIGQSLADAPAVSCFFKELFYYRQFLFFSLCLVYICAALTATLLRQSPGIFVITAVVPACILVLALCIKKRNIPAVCVSITKWLLTCIEICRGLAHKPLPAASYPRNAETIKG